jgi:ATP synthase protein I
MPSNDARNLVPIAVPTAAAGVVAVAVSAAVAGGKGAIGAAVGALLAMLFMGIGLYVLQWTAKTLPQLFQAMGLMLYVAQLLLLMIFVALFKGTSLFNGKAFALSLVVATVVWMAAQARAHMKAKIFYIDPDSAKSEKPEKTGPKQ